MFMRARVSALLFAVVATHTWAAEPKTLKGTKTQSAPKIDLGLPSFGALPKADGLQKNAPPKEQTAPTQAAPAETAITIQSVTHSKMGKGGAAPVSSIFASGNPLMTDKFSSNIKVKSPTKRSTGIEVAILDGRGQSVMEASGTLNFRTGSDETEWHVDWDGSTIRAAGDFVVQVTVGGDTKATFPLKIEAR